VIRWTIPALAALGGEFLRWEIATAAAGAALGVDPFDEPNVTEAKQATQAVLQRYLDEGALPARQSLASANGLEVEAPAWIADTLRRKANGAEPPAWLAALLAHARSGDYVALLAYLHRTPERHARLEGCGSRAGRRHDSRRRSATARASALDRTVHWAAPERAVRTPSADEGDDLPIRASATASGCSAQRRRWATTRCSHAGSAACSASTSAATWSARSTC
jgi:hypothetical protein